MARIWELFPDVAERVRETHQKVGLVGPHDWCNAYRVGEVARQIALDEWGDKDMFFMQQGLQSPLSCIAGVAGLCYNANRILRPSHTGVSLSHSIVELVGYWMGRAVTLEGGRIVIDAVLKNDGRNSPEDSKVLIALMDAEHIVNLDVDLFIRSGRRFPSDSAVDYQQYLNDPTATCRNTKYVLRDIAYSLDLADPKSPVCCVRTRLGKFMAERRVQVCQIFLLAMESQLEAEGMHPYPFPS